MVVVAMLLHAEIGRNDHRENASHFEKGSVLAAYIFCTLGIKNWRFTSTPRSRKQWISCESKIFKMHLVGFSWSPDVKSISLLIGTRAIASSGPSFCVENGLKWRIYNFNVLFRSGIHGLKPIGPGPSGSIRSYDQQNLRNLGPTKFKKSRTGPANFQKSWFNSD